MSNKEATLDKPKSRLNLKQYGMVIALVVIFLIFSALSGGTNASPMNINNLIMQNSYVVILAIGMLLCIITGNVDLSVGSVVAFTGAIAAIFMLDNKMNIWLVCLIVLVAGVLIGMWEGLFIAYLGVPPFIVTLANMLIFRGLTMVVLNGQTKGPLPESFKQISTGYFPTFKLVFSHANGTQTKLDLIALAAGIIATIILIFVELKAIKTKKKFGFDIPPTWQTILKLVVIAFGVNFITFKLASYNGLPIILGILLALILIYGFITNRTVIGRQIYAVGGNAKAALLSGIKTKKVMFWVYTNMGLMAAVAGLVLAARNGSATPKAGDGFELDAIASCYIGGASAYGGTGTIVGAVVGALIMGILNNGMSIIGWSVDIQRVVKGLVLLGAVTLDLLSKKKGQTA